MSLGSEQERLVVATVMRAHGLEGVLQIRLETDRPEEVFQPGRTLRVESPPPGAPATLEISHSQAHGRGWLLRVREVTDRSTAERYGGHRLTVERSGLSELEPDEYFLHELIGLDILDETGRLLGRVADVYDAPANPVLALRVEDRETLIPFRREFVTEVDLRERRVVVRLLEGMLDL
ncbi:MAG: ribosome maturation factor RimM [Gemmatimonadota bacterium]